MVTLEVEVYEGMFAEDAPEVILAREVCRRLTELPQFQALCAASGKAEDAPDVRAIVLLCGNAQFAQWDVPDNAVGLHAVTAGPFLDINDLEASGYMTRHLVALNVDAGRQAFYEMLDDDLADVAEAWCVTIPHEAVHLADLLRVGEGKTPDEIWAAEGDWGLHVASTLDGTEWDPVPCSEEGDDEPDPEERNTFVEERVECIARDWMRHVLPDPRVLWEQAERIATQVTGIALSQKGLGLTP